MSHGVNLGVREILLIAIKSGFVIVAEAVEVGHASGGTELARRPNPAPHPVLVGLLTEPAQAGADLAICSRRVERIGRGLELLCRRKLIERGGRLQTHIRADPTPALDAGNFMTSEAPVF